MSGSGDFERRSTRQATGRADRPTPRRLVALVRHGEEDLAGPEPVLASESTRGLSGRGRAQAEAAADLLAGLDCAEVVSSPLPRAAETAAVLAGGRRVRFDPRLRGLDLGRWEGVPSGMADRLAEIVQLPGGRPPGGESLAELRERATAAVRAALDAEDDVIVVAHRMTNAVILAELLGLELERAPLIQQAPGAVNLLQERRDGRLRPAALNVTPADPLRLGERTVGVL